MSLRWSREPAPSHQARVPSDRRRRAPRAAPGRRRECFGTGEQQRVHRSKSGDSLAHRSAKYPQQLDHEQFPPTHGCAPGVIAAGSSLSLEECYRSAPRRLTRLILPRGSIGGGSSRLHRFMVGLLSRRCRTAVAFRWRSRRGEKVGAGCLFPERILRTDARPRCWSGSSLGQDVVLRHRSGTRWADMSWVQHPGLVVVGAAQGCRRCRAR